MNDSIFIPTAIELGNLYFKLGRNEEAESFFTKVRAMLAVSLQNNIPAYLGSSINLAGVFIKTRRFKEAHMLFEELEQFIEAHPSYKNHSFYLNLKNNEVVYYMDNNLFEEGVKYSREVVNLYRQMHGFRHSSTATALTNLGISCYYTGRFKEMEESFREVLDYDITSMTDAIYFLSDRELAAYIENADTRLNRYLNFASSANSSASHLPALCYDNILFNKGFLQHSAATLKYLATTDSTLTSLIERQRIYHQLLLKELINPVVDGVVTARLQNYIDSLEKELARKVPRKAEANAKLQWRNIQENLKSGEAAIEFVRYTVISDQPTDSVLYAALLVRPEDTEPCFVILFEEKQLSQLLFSTLTDETTPNFKAYQNRGFVRKRKGSQNGLYDLIWRPIDSLLYNYKVVYYSPAGLLHQVNFDAIPSDSLRILADSLHLVRLVSTRELIDFEKPYMGKSNSAVLYGGIYYEADSTVNTNAISESKIGKTLNNKSLKTPPLDRHEMWGYLLWTAKEVDTLSALLRKVGMKPIVKKGFQANENSFKTFGTQKTSPRILHLATHGYFFPNPSDSAVFQPPSRYDMYQIPAYSQTEHPMIRSGLILSQANGSWLSGSPPGPNAEDGILTAYEISQLNLADTELAVLSACETGLGDLRGNEGIYGLQRAFKIAGVRNIIISLWQVPDYQTQELMVIFYSYWLEKKIPISEAFRLAQQSMRRKYSDPELWAGFILIE